MKDILVGEVPARFGERHDGPARVLELHDRELAPEGVARDVAARPPRALGQRRELPFEGAVETDGQRGCLHVRQCNTWTIFCQEPVRAIGRHLQSIFFAAVLSVRLCHVISGDQQVGGDAEHVSERSDLVDGKPALAREELGDATFPAHDIVQVGAAHATLVEHERYDALR